MHVISIPGVGTHVSKKTASYDDDSGDYICYITLHNP